VVGSLRRQRACKARNTEDLGLQIVPAHRRLMRATDHATATSHLSSLLRNCHPDHDDAAMFILHSAILGTVDARTAPHTTPSSTTPTLFQYHIDKHNPLSAESPPPVDLNSWVPYSFKVLIERSCSFPGANTEITVWSVAGQDNTRPRRKVQQNVQFSRRNRTSREPLQCHCRWVCGRL
jgi:hypothetical protein